jgi:hypothetical protein
MVFLTTTVERVRRYRRIRSTVVLPKGVEALWGPPNALDGVSDYRRRIRSTVVLPKSVEALWGPPNALDGVSEYHRRTYSTLPSNTFDGGAA